MYECITGMWVCVQTCISAGMRGQVSATLPQWLHPLPCPALPRPPLTCLSTVIFESLVISAAWFRRSTTWKNGRTRCCSLSCQPGPIPAVLLFSAVWATSFKGRSQTLSLPASPSDTHPLRSGHAINAWPFFLCKELGRHTPAGDTVPAAACHGCCQVFPGKETSQLPCPPLLPPRGRIQGLCP